jgi:tagatose 1,6-diphosphate aldolase GatY/KbaY
MLAHGTAALHAAHRDGRALAAFSVYDLEQALAVCAAAEQTGAPVLLQAGSSAFAYAGLEPLAALALASARASSAEVGVHLDHATSEEEVARCLELGYTSVMFDGSALAFEENVRRTRAVVERAHACDAWVEAELAGFAGEEDETIEAAAGALTDPAQAERFVAETGVDALAVAIGNVHGIPSRPVVLDFERLAQIRDRVDVPLVLHGASGLPDEDIRRAIVGGVAKINVNTELRRAFRTALGRVAASPPPGDGLPAYLQPAIDAMREVAVTKLRAFDARESEVVGDAR